MYLVCSVVNKAPDSKLFALISFAFEHMFKIEIESKIESLDWAFV